MDAFSLLCQCFHTDQGKAFPVLRSWPEEGSVSPHGVWAVVLVSRTHPLRASPSLHIPSRHPLLAICDGLPNPTILLETYKEYGVHVCVCKFTCVSTPVKAWRTPGVFLDHFSLYSLGRGLSLDHRVYKPRYPGNQLIAGIYCVHLPTSGITGGLPCPPCVHKGSGDQTVTTLEWQVSTESALQPNTSVLITRKTSDVLLEGLLKMVYWSRSSKTPKSC